jgi:hypothetical protein
VAVERRRGGGGSFRLRGSDDGEDRWWLAAVGEGSCGTGERRGRLGTHQSPKGGKVWWCSLQEGVDNNGALKTGEGRRRSGRQRGWEVEGRVEACRSSSMQGEKGRKGKGGQQR